MHLVSSLLVPAGTGSEPVDLRQTPGDIVILSAADSELAGLAQAARRLGTDFPSVRLANLLRLAHPYAVDLYVDTIVTRAKLVVVRLLGGKSYWSYGIEQLVAACRAGRIPLLVLPGDPRPDAELSGWSTVGENELSSMAALFDEGGPVNARKVLQRCAHLLGQGERPGPPEPLPRVGLYHPDIVAPLLDDIARQSGPRTYVVFYRALYQSGDLEPIDAMIAALGQHGVQSYGVWVSSLKDPMVANYLAELLQTAPPSILLNATAFAVGADDPLGGAGCPVLQVLLGAEPLATWKAGKRGLSAKDLAMQVALPELDGRITTTTISFKSTGERDPICELDLTRHAAVADRVKHVAALARAWVDLGRAPAPERRVAIVLGNYPVREGRLANGVGLDTPASCVVILRALVAAGYNVGAVPRNGNALIELLQAGPTNTPEGRSRKQARAHLPLERYRSWLEAQEPMLVEAVLERWGPPETDPFVVEDHFVLAALPLGNVVVVLQPPRGWHLDPEQTAHDPELVPPHGYLATYLWLRQSFGAQALVHLGKHGTVEWLPGKALALSSGCWPERVIGALPLLYPFIVNDPGEGTQAKRRNAAVIIDHLTPPLTQAGAHGEQAELERLLDEHALAAGLDPRRLASLETEIVDWARRLGLATDLDLGPHHSSSEQLMRLDRHLCDLKSLQIRDGLHVLGQSPAGAERIDLLLAILRLARGAGAPANASLTSALAQDLGLEGFDPSTVDPALPWEDARPATLAMASEQPWRIAGDTVERLELVARRLVAGEMAPQPVWHRTRAVLDWLDDRIAPALDRSGALEVRAILDGLDGRRIAPGPSGAPSRGRADVLPTGRNFYSIDCRAVPTPTAWQLGWRSAQELCTLYLQTHGEWPKRIALSAWGTANMRTGGDDIAQALALMGCRPIWEGAGGRVTGIEVLPVSLLDRPRVDVTLRVSGLFRDAFPEQLGLLDDAVRAVAALDEPEELNPLAAAVTAECQALIADGEAPERAARRATLRLFGAAPGSYGTGMQGLMDTGKWRDERQLAETFLRWGDFAYGRGLEGNPGGAAFGRRLARIDLVLHNQDNREHDLMDSDDYWQFEGGLTMAVRLAGGRSPEVFHADHSRPERPRIRPLKEEIGLIVRGRASNPRWIEGVMRHGYKGAFEIAATVDYLFAFAATTRMVEEHHFAALFDAYLLDERVRSFMADNNRAALRETADRFAEAIERGFWQPRRNRVSQVLDQLRQVAGTSEEHAQAEQDQRLGCALPGDHSLTADLALDTDPQRLV